MDGAAGRESLTTGVWDLDQTGAGAVKVEPVSQVSPSLAMPGAQIEITSLLVADDTNDEFLIFTLHPLRSNRPSLRDDFTVTIARSSPDYGGLWQIHDIGSEEM